MDEFIERLAQCMATAKMTQKQLAQEVGISQGFLSDVMNKHRGPGKRLCTRMAEFEQSRNWPAPPEGFIAYWHRLGALAEGWKI